MGSSRHALWKRRIHPKLRMIMNGDPSVNATRAENLGCLKVTQALAKEAVPVRQGVAASQARAMKTSVGDLDKSAPRDDVTVSIFAELKAGSRTSKLPGFVREEGNLAMLRCKVDDVEKLAKRRSMSFIQPAENLTRPGAVKNAAVTAHSDACAHSLVCVDADDAGGEDVLIGIIDVEGFDWLHGDFEDGNGDSRFHSIWDQSPRRGPKPEGFDYGVEINAAAMKKAKCDAVTVGVSPHDLEPQSEMVPGAHGTHVASIAAGNHGVCNRATIAGVLLSAPRQDRTQSFYDSTQLIDAVLYLIDLGEKLKKSVSINISLGTNGHAHDGSSALDRWLDALIEEPGRSICAAAGNAGQERATEPGDLGFIFGRIHTAAKIEAKGLEADFEWVVAGDGVIDVSENELEFWYEPQDRIAISIKPPGSNKWIGPIAPGELIENLQLPNKTFLSVYNELYKPANGSNYISCYLSPFYGREVVVGIEAGTWLVRLHGLDIRDGRVQGWIERDDPFTIDDDEKFWPSYFSAKSNVDDSSISSLACGQRIVAVANYDEENRRINISSSQGPTRDGRQKPDIAAPGTEIIAANGFDGSTRQWISMTGTSMASPYVAGVIGLMLSAEPKLTAAQINGILKATAKPITGQNFDWANDHGFGVVDAAAAIDEAKNVYAREDVGERFE